MKKYRIKSNIMKRVKKHNLTKCECGKQHDRLFKIPNDNAKNKSKKFVPMIKQRKDLI